MMTETMVKPTPQTISLPRTGAVCFQKLPASRRSVCSMYFRRSLTLFFRAVSAMHHRTSTVRATVVEIAAPAISRRGNPQSPAMSAAFISMSPAMHTALMTPACLALPLFFSAQRYTCETPASRYDGETMRRYVAPSAMRTGSLVSRRIRKDGTHSAARKKNHATMTVIFMT